MAVQLSHPQGAYVCGFCSFTSPDHRVLVKHLMDHCGFKEKKHEHILWCGLCKPSLTDANPIDGHQQAMINESHLSGSMYHDNDLGYGGASNYYPGYNGLYNPYVFQGTYYYPMNVTYRNPCYGNVNNGYYQTPNTIFYTDDFYGGTDVFPNVDTPRFIESAPENKYLMDAPHNSENTQDADSFKSSSNDITLSDFEHNSNDSGIETFSVHPQIFPVENSLNKSRYQQFRISETSTFSESMTNAELNVVHPNELGTIPITEPQPRVNKSNIQPTPDKTLSRKSSGTRAKKLSSKGTPDPKLNAVQRNPFQTNVREANHSETAPKNLTESSYLEIFSEPASEVFVSSFVDTNSGIKTNVINMNAHTEAIPVPIKGCCSKLPTEKIAEPFENEVNASSAKEPAIEPEMQALPVSFREAGSIERTVSNNASDVTKFSMGVEVDTLSRNALTKECNSSQLRTCEREAPSENLLGKVSTPAEDLNFVPISDAESPRKVKTTILTEDTSYVDTGSIDVKGPLTTIDLNEIHSERPTGKSETLSKIKTSISVLSENDTPVSDVEHSPKNKVEIIRKNSVSDNQFQSIGMTGDPKKKDQAFSDSKQEATSSEIDCRKSLVKTGTREDALNRNSRRKSKDNCTAAITESSKECQSDKTGALSNVGSSLRNSCRSDLNYISKNCGSVSVREGIHRLTYCEVLKRGLSLKS